jgi:hypothetical protein
VAFWPARAILERFVVLERVAPRFDSSLVLAYNVLRFLKAGTEFHMISSSPDAGVYIGDLSILPSATFSRLDDPDFDPTLALDGRDDTFARTTIASLAPGATIIVAQFDLGSVGRYLIHAHVFANPPGWGTLLNAGVRISVDGATWTDFCVARPDWTTCFAITDVRYLRLFITNVSGATRDPRVSAFATVEVYIPGNKRVRATSNITRNVRAYTLGYSSLYEVIPL